MQRVEQVTISNYLMKTNNEDAGTMYVVEEYDEKNRMTWYFGSLLQSINSNLMKRKRPRHKVVDNKSILRFKMC